LEDDEGEQVAIDDQRALLRQLLLEELGENGLNRALERFRGLGRNEYLQAL
jgi:hypothetical protein